MPNGAVKEAEVAEERAALPDREPDPTGLAPDVAFDTG